MKKLFPLLSLFIVFLILSTSCTENTEQPSSSASNANSSSIVESTPATTNASLLYGKFGLIGKMFDKTEANSLFGKVVNSLTLSTADLNAALAQGNNYILFTIKNNQVVICNENRKFLSRVLVNIGKDEKMYMFSKSMIQNLLNSSSAVKFGNSAVGTSTLSKTASTFVTVEMRASVMSLSYGDATLEMAMPCPPFCNE